MEHLDARLGTIAAMVPRCRAVADIGCDHGLLVAALLEGGRCDYGIAADINPMPLEKARQELTRRGIDRDTAEAAMQTFSPDEEQMLALLKKRLRGDVSDRKEVEKAVAALQRRGFAWNDIKRALETYGSSLPEEE